MVLSRNYGRLKRTLRKLNKLSGLLNLVQTGRNWPKRKIGFCSLELNSSFVSPRGEFITYPNQRRNDFCVRLKRHSLHRRDAISWAAFSILPLRGGQFLCC